jgi:hypothetical protein
LAEKSAFRPCARDLNSTGWAFLVNLIVAVPKFGIAPYLH